MPDTVTINNLSNDGTYDMPFNLSVSYTADDDGLEVAVEYSGYTVSPQDAPSPSGTLPFQLNWGGDVTNGTVVAKLREKADPTVVLATDEKDGLTFLGGGPP